MVVGLGNPGAQYANTRHNVGHMLIDLLAHNAGVQLSSHRSGTHCADIRLGMLPGGIPGPRVILATSDSYMNTSGGPIGRLAKFMNVDPSHLLVVHDDLDLPAGALRLKTGGGEGGHNDLPGTGDKRLQPPAYRYRTSAGTHEPSRLCLSANEWQRA